MAIRDNKDYIRVLPYSYYTTITGWGVLLRNNAMHATAVPIVHLAGSIIVTISAKSMKRGFLKIIPIEFPIRTVTISSESLLLMHSLGVCRGLANSETQTSYSWLRAAAKSALDGRVLVAHYGQGHCLLSQEPGDGKQCAKGRLASPSMAPTPHDCFRNLGYSTATVTGAFQKGHARDMRCQLR